jgi:hypothetical protein
MKEIMLDNKTITHLLGYLKAEQWDDAIKNYADTIDLELLWKLVDIQGITYCYNLRTAIEEVE